MRGGTPGFLGFQEQVGPRGLQGILGSLDQELAVTLDFPVQGIADFQGSLVDLGILGFRGIRVTAVDPGTQGLVDIREIAGTQVFLALVGVLLPLRVTAGFPGKAGTPVTQGSVVDQATVDTRGKLDQLELLEPAGTPDIVLLLGFQGTADIRDFQRLVRVNQDTRDFLGNQVTQDIRQ